LKVATKLNPSDGVVLVFLPSGLIAAYCQR